MVKGSLPQNHERVLIFEGLISKSTKNSCFGGGHSLKTMRGYVVIFEWLISQTIKNSCFWGGHSLKKPWEGSNIWTISWLGIKPWEGMHFRGSDPLQGLFHMFFSMLTLPTHIGGPSLNLKSTRAPQSFSLRSILSHNLCHWYTISNQDKPHWSWDDHILLRVDKSE